MSEIRKGKIFEWKEPETSWSREAGWQRSQTGVGIQSACRGWAARIASQGAADAIHFRPDHDSPMGEVTVMHSLSVPNATADKGVTRFEIIAEEREVDGFLSVAGKSLDASTIATIRGKLKREAAYIPTILTGTALTLYTVMNRGATHFIDWAFTLRRTITISQQSDAEQIYTGVGTVILSHNSVAVDASVPQGTHIALASIPFPASDATYEWAGWLKKAPQVLQSQRDKLELSQDYVLAPWLKIYYPTSVA